MKSIPKQVRNWFKIHFLIDMFVAFPLFFAPVSFLAFFGFDPLAVDPSLSRIVASAFFAIGGMSLWMNTERFESFIVMLRLKLIWSASATLGLLWGALEGGPSILWFFAAIFGAFFVLWQYWYNQIQ
ncbi:hypothetical protein HOA92_04705 [archaeon]|jgi:hypothetical protein|nr:hypothetical protein [archaeon]MBT6762317.1 hypothetical protein [archaeon]